VACAKGIWRRDHAVEAFRCIAGAAGARACVAIKCQDVRAADAGRVRRQAVRRSRVIAGLEDEEDDDMVEDDDMMDSDDADGDGDGKHVREGEGEGEGEGEREGASGHGGEDLAHVAVAVAVAVAPQGASAAGALLSASRMRGRVVAKGAERMADAGRDAAVSSDDSKDACGGGKRPKAAAPRELRALALESIYSEREREAEKERAEWVGGVGAARSRAASAGGEPSDHAQGRVRATRGMIAGTSAACARAPCELYILIHNADTMGLRQGDAQRALATLAAAPGIHLIVSMDHVNGALTWDPTLRAKFNWVWTDVTTFGRYTDESPYVSGAGIFAGEDQMKSALVVLRSLNNNSKGIMAILIKHQLASKTSQGLTFAALYERCRENFLVSSESALKNHLAELKDHKIVREVLLRVRLRRGCAMSRGLARQAAARRAAVLCILLTAWMLQCGSARQG
jgi:hypothetical protein